MLVLGRKKTETIVLPELGIRFTIVRVGGERVRVGIEAPEDVRIVRGELCDWEPESKPETDTTSEPKECLV